MAVRYDQQTKDKVVDFVREYNESHGRGGQSAAVAKWSISPLTVKSWLDKAGVSTPSKPIMASPFRSTNLRKTDPDCAINTLERMAEIQTQLSKLESEYFSLKSTL
ncbi:MAG: hypothetical protein CMO55_16895 [Verrucomicrobiales bacterium]|nr:hypothetical protein [Verrucomicrobiales bacterium]